MKKMTVREVFNYLSDWAPLSLAEDWDAVGLQAGSLNSEVSGILVSLDVTEKVLKEAKSKKCNLLITHHPLKFESLKKLNPKSIPEKLTRLALRYKINILSFHTNLDSTSEGLNDLLANQLKLKKMKPLMKSKNSKFPKAGLGRMGHIRPVSLKQFLRHLSQSLKLRHFRFVGDLNKKIQKVAVMTGSGAGYFLAAKQKGADVLVTGDAKYHGALDVLSENFCLVDIGHYAGEIGMVAAVAQRLESWLKSRKQALKVYETRVQSDPLRFWPL